MDYKKLLDEINKALSSRTEENEPVYSFAEIKACIEKITSHDLIKDIIETEKENKELILHSKLFTSLFFLQTVLPGKTDECRKTVLSFMEDELKDTYKLSIEEVNRYIDSFNENFKEISMIFVKLNSENLDDSEFQDRILSEFSDYLLNNLIIRNNELPKISEVEKLIQEKELKKVLSYDLYKSIELAFNFNVPNLDDTKTK